MVGVTGFEPATPCTPCKYSTRLSYTPTADAYYYVCLKITIFFWEKTRIVCVKAHVYIKSVRTSINNINKRKKICQNLKIKRVVVKIVLVCTWARTVRKIKSQIVINNKINRPIGRFLFGCAIRFYHICDLLLLCNCTGRWYCTRVAFASGLTWVAHKCNVLAKAVRSVQYRFVQIFNRNIPIFLRNRLWIVTPHLFYGINGAPYARGCITDMGNGRGNVVLGGLIVA